MTQSTQTKDDEEAEADAQQRVEKRLHADAIDYVNEQAEAEQKGECLEPNERAARVVGSGFRFFGEFFCFTGCPVVCELFSRFNQGAALTPLAVCLSCWSSLRAGNSSFNNMSGELSESSFPEFGNGIVIIA